MASPRSLHPSFRRMDRLGRLVAGEPFVTDGGLETVLIFHEGHDLPYFAAFDLLRSASGSAAIRAYYEPYVRVALDRGVGFVFETPTWRASPDWAARLGYDCRALDDALYESVEIGQRLREEHETDATPIILSGNLGPRGDGYLATNRMTAEGAAEYHGAAIATFASAGVDLVTALTITYAEEAEGIAHAAAAHRVPVVISFTLETDGRLPSGQSLRDAIRQVDAATTGGPCHYMINCAHPSHFAAELEGAGAWAERIRGIRANASKKSHAELDESVELDEGDPADLAAHYSRLRRLLPYANVVGGCCGTDHRHVRRALDAWLEPI